MVDTRPAAPPTAELDRRSGVDRFLKDFCRLSVEIDPFAPGIFPNGDGDSPDEAPATPEPEFDANGEVGLPIGSEMFCIGPHELASPAAVA